MKYYKVREDYLLELLRKADELDAIFCADSIPYEEYEEFVTKSDDLAKQLNNYEEC